MAAAAAVDPATAYKLLLSCPTGLPQSRVSVKFDQSFDRIPHPDAALEESINEIWNQRLQQNPSLYSGTKFRPQEIGILNHQADEKDLALINERVSREMFDGIIREVVEETGVPANSLTEPVFIGVSRREMNVRPTAFFFTKCSIDSSGVHELYSTAQDGYESTKMYAVSEIRFFSNNTK
uniref:Nudix hydrolase domain-containing protein n=1 Tax=Leersia perrieri TaxID=77586 RepID=A0A0D9WC33_9ORYZ